MNLLDAVSLLVAQPCFFSALVHMVPDGKLMFLSNQSHTAIGSKDL